MPEIFLSKKNSLPLYNEKENNYPAKVILEKNFRSRKEITDFVNFAFTSLMSEQIGDMEYTEEEHLVPEAPYDTATAPSNELHLVDITSDEDINPAVAEARYIAALIRKKCAEDYIKDGDTKRPLLYKDFAIIMRNKSSYGDTYANELIRCGVPAVCETAAGFLTAHEIMVAVNFLRVIDNPLQDIPLLSVLMSPVYGFTPDDLASMRAQNRKESLYISLKKYAKSGDEKSCRFLEDIVKLRNLALTLPSDLFINTLYEETNLISILSAGQSKRVTDNLRLLSEYAANFENGGSKGISAFVDYLDKLTRSGTDLPPAAVSNSDSDNVVRVMTIHSSKGLEFPVCIIANTAREFKSDTKNNVLLHSKLGFASKRRDNALMCSYSTLPRDAASLEVKRSEMSEEIRVLYVAMTRAKEQLVMVTTKKKMSDYVSKLGAKLTASTKLSPFIVRDSRFLSDWIVMLALMHPGGKELRQYARIDEPCEFSCEDTGNFTVVFCDKVPETSQLPTGTISGRTVYEELPSDVGEIIRSRFDYDSYPDAGLTTLPLKVTASSLAHKDTSGIFSRILSKPAFLKDTHLTPAQKGTAMQTFMQYCDFEKARFDIAEEIKRLVNSNRLTESQAQVLDTKNLSDFIGGEIVTRALNADEYMREYRFTVNIPAYLADHDVDPAIKDHPLIHQGA
ncbi:MAG: helicase-exonuclease AddAB subunit AddA, partial [Ruminococcus sp.]|nr:helicase-exonuclease AddAB subunit AddA [Ruminococcus sp.]